MAVLTAFLVYGFGEYGVDAMEMASPGFALAWTSTVLASGSALFLAYPLSFLTRAQDLLRFCLAEPMRWMLTTGVVAAGLILCRGRRCPGRALALAVSYGALITPYIMRLYLTPDAVNYHISYVLSGRVFYLPFTVIALGWGLAVARLLSAVRGRKWSWALLSMPIAAYVHALWLYSPADFIGLNVVRDPGGPLPARWNPFDRQEPLWLLVASVVLVGVWFVRRAMDRRGSKPAAGTDAKEDRP
jgi:hypothetical protein